ncbi:serine protease [Vibrio albus]|uniref:Serine protease n=1 Tax=Vibrio albus TaxID=2200953 RepID=A0A2U3BD24_9VIBR|nr:patatin-like phospholipase family protein [Vibrio albus]PWI34698.1 serine protease [Vibrio albus]
MAAQSRPEIAVVLAGGGAKGAAHAGVLKALEEMYIPVDIITGTSMGAYIGGLYATGMSADEIGVLINTVDWNSGYVDRVGRGDRRVRDKAYEDYYQIITDLGISMGEIRSPKGMVQGQGMMHILRETSGNLPRFSSFDNLAIPYRAVATDIVKLEEVVLDKGLLTDAMMASMSVPGALPPYELDGRLLVDGGVTNNMPVGLAKEMGADAVIAVDISTDYFDKDEVTDLVTVAGQISNYMVRRTTNAQADLLTDSDVLLIPEVGNMETTEFDRLEEAYRRGYDVALTMRDTLQRYSVSAQQYQQYLDEKEDRRRILRYGDEQVVDLITINNHSHYSDELIQERLGLEVGNRYSTEELESSVQALYALDRFERIFYHYQKQAEQTELVIDVYEKEWGPNYVNLRFYLEDDFDTESQYALGISSNFTGLNSVGGELKVNLELGTDRRASVEWFSPSFFTRKLFSTLEVSYQNDNKRISVEGFDAATPLDSTENYLDITYKDVEAEATIGVQPELWTDARFGLRYTDGSAELSTIPSMGDMNYTRQGAFISYRLDTLDDYSFPSRGGYLNLEYLVSDDTVSGAESSSDLLTDQNGYDDEFVHEITAIARGAYSLDRHTLVGHAEYGVVEGKSDDNPPIRPKELGGFLRLSGIPRNSLTGQNLLFGSLVYTYKWFDNDFGLFTTPVYLGASMEYGGVWSDNSVSVSEAPLYSAGSIFVGIRSPIGPVILAAGSTEHHFNSLYFIVGQTF